MAGNVLIIMSDEHRRDAMGCAGHRLVKTPNVDALAARGAVFEYAYTPSPMCVPARASFACGDHVHRTGYWDSASPYDGRQESWMHRVRTSGVPVTSIGKLHFRSADDDNGFTEEILPMHVVGGVGWAVGLLRENPNPYEAARELADDVGIGRSSYTDYDLAITEAAENWIQEKAGQSEPWVAFVSLVSPHYPLTCPEAFANVYDPDEMPLPIGYGTAGAHDHQEVERLAGFFDYDRYFDEAKTRAGIAAYFGLVSFMDDCVGRILRVLAASGQADETTVIYTSDHGEMLGDHGLWTKQVMYESSVGVPLIVSGPGVERGRRVQTATSLLDVAATICETAGSGADNATTLPGRSLLDLAGEPYDPDRVAFSEYHDGGSSTGAFMIRWDRWKYVHYAGLPPQLFDLEANPDERIDLAASSNKPTATIAALKEGEARLRAICDPDAVNAQCFADQARRIEELGGEEVCRTGFVFNHTPIPKSVLPPEPS